MSDFKLSVNRKVVYKESSDYLENYVGKRFATKKEWDKNKDDGIYPENRDSGDIYLEAYMIPIDVLRKMLDKAEKKGANFVSVDFHCDHFEYDIYGLKVERTSEDELVGDLEDTWLADEKKTKDKIIKLEKELAELKRNI